MQMSNQIKVQRKLRLLHNTSLNTAVEMKPQYDSMFSYEAEQRINNWLDAQNIIQQTPEQHFRDFFQNNKDTVQNQISIFISHQSFNSLPEIELSSQSSCSSSVSSPASLDLKKSPMLTRRRLNIDGLLTNKSSQSSIPSIPDTVQEFQC